MLLWWIFQAMVRFSWDSSQNHGEWHGDSQWIMILSTSLYCISIYTVYLYYIILYYIIFYIIYRVGSNPPILTNQRQNLWLCACVVATGVPGGCGGCLPCLSRHGNVGKQQPIYKQTIFHSYYSRTVVCETVRYCEILWDIVFRLPEGAFLLDMSFAQVCPMNQARKTAPIQQLWSQDPAMP